MVERLRALLEHPLDPSTARAIVVLAGAILLGLVGLFALSAAQPESAVIPPAKRPSAASSPALLAPSEGVKDEAADARRPSTPRQDPQDRKGSAAAERAARALRLHRALQHVPYRDGGVSIELVGARGSRALLRVSAPNVPAARRGWLRFLRRFDDAGRSYLPFFKSRRRDG